MGYYKNLVLSGLENKKHWAGSIQQDLSKAVSQAETGCYKCGTAKAPWLCWEHFVEEYDKEQK